MEEKLENSQNKQLGHVTCFACGNCNPSESFFVIPKDEQRRKLWLEGAGITDCVLPRTPTLCRLHFTDDSFCHSSDQKIYTRTRLKKDAVPTIRVDSSKLKYFRTKGRVKKPKKNRCFACGSSRNLENYSLFRFPKDIEDRNVWLRNLGLENVSPPTYESRLCSKHFCRADVIGNPKITLRTLLRKGAAPYSIINVDNITFEEVHVDENSIFNIDVAEIDFGSTDNTEIHSIDVDATRDTETDTFANCDSMNFNINGIESVEILDTNTPDDSLHNIEEAACQVDDNLFNQVEVYESTTLGPNVRDVACQVDVSSLTVGCEPISSSTSHAVEDIQKKWSNAIINDAPSLPVFSSANGSIKLNDRHRKVNLKKPRYVGDVSISDLSTPERAMQCFLLSKEKVVSQQKTIQTLTRHLVQSRKKVDKLQDLVERLTIALHEKSLSVDDGEICS